jgi:hypothetical protein
MQLATRRRLVTTLLGLLARISKLEHLSNEATMPTGEGLAALLPLLRSPRNAEQERADDELLARCLAGKDDLSSTMGLHRLLLETRLEQMRTRLLEDQAGEGSDAL